jgi:ABC-type antimicrobial peptide transport system permease subunit
MAVSQRTQEIGLRMALGAQFRDVLRLILSQGMRMTLIGIVLGLAGAFALTRVFARMLLGVGATDAVTFVGVPLLLIAVKPFSPATSRRGAHRASTRWWPCATSEPVQIR